MRTKRIRRQNIQSFCRTCLREISKLRAANGEKYNVFTTQDLANWIIGCTQLEVEKNDGYPKFVCHECYLTLHTQFEFRTKCIESIHFLEGLLGQNGSDLEVSMALESTTPKNEVLENEDIQAYKLKQDWEKIFCETSNLFPLDSKNTIADEDVVDKNMVSNSQQNQILSGNEQCIKNESINNEHILESPKTFEYKHCCKEDVVETNDFVRTKNCSLEDVLKISYKNEHEFSEESLEEVDLKEPKNKPSHAAIDSCETQQSKKKSAILIQCKLCRRRCISEESLAAHLRVHQGLRAHQCNHCERSFNRITRLKAHIKIVHTNIDETLTCNFKGCEKQFRRVDSLRAHKRIKHSGTEKSISENNFEVLDINQTVEHKQSIEEVISKITDPKNTLNCTSSDSLEISSKNESKSSEESLLEETNINKTKQPRHRLVNNKPAKITPSVKKSKSRFACKVCPRHCVSEESLAAHLRVHEGLKAHQCNQCERSFNKITRLKMHIKVSHTNIVEHFYCSFEGCGQQFTRIDTLRAHERIKHRDKEKPISVRTYICDDCGCSLKNATKLKEHRYRHRPYEEHPFECDKCGKRFIRKSAFREHQMRHDGIKNHVCPYCGMRKTTGHELKTHINYHTKEKQWPCPHCPMVFSSSANLGMHDRVVHQSIRRFACRFCDQTFGKSMTHKHHEMRHTGEKPHECQLCGKRFIQSVALRAHLKTQHKVDGRGVKITVIQRQSLADSNQKELKDTYPTVAKV